MRIALAVALLAASLAGCTQAATDDLPAATPSVAPALVADEPVVNASDPAPTALLSADVVRGAAPLNVTLQLAGNDPEGQFVRWALDWTGDGRPDLTGNQLPANATVAFRNAGEHQVLFAVHDGNRATQTSLQILVE